MKQNIPQHVGFIMDGNRRWARKNKKSLFLGHNTGAHQIEPLIDLAIEKGITHITFWAFSTENWNRPKKEVDILMKVFRNIFNDPMMKRLAENKGRLYVLGDIKNFPKDIQEQVKKIVSDTQKNRRITVNMALNYGGRDEILKTVNKLLTEGKKNIDETTFSNSLYTYGQPNPDLIIRTGGEKRLSGFFPWQSVYAELYFTDVLWPDFTAQEFEKALIDYEHRSRRFGK